LRTYYLLFHLGLLASKVKYENSWMNHQLNDYGVFDVIVSKETAEHYIWGSVCDGWHFVKQEDLSVIYERMPSGTSEVRHFHNKSRQFFFILSGIATIEVDGERHQIEKFQGIEVAPGIPHQMTNQLQSDIEFIVISQPMSHGDRITLRD
jgi:mannose-6-phosphate isomerase-like protein (cupin superfamily)